MASVAMMINPDIIEKDYIMKINYDITGKDKMFIQDTYFMCFSSSVRTALNLTCSRTGAKISLDIKISFAPKVVFL
jgi:hypothetical protein